MFLKRIREILYGSFTDKNLSFTVLDKFLEIKGYGFGGTEVFHVLGDFDPHFFAEAEKMIDTVLAGHDDSLKLIGADAILAKVLFRNGLDVIEGSPVYLDAIFLLNVVVW